ncbi:MAG: hypothetical protein EHM45_12780 [Desulfobacteraceae bacterium]|nr:MAG: hypothetical protein EHM45_12780 [Desulfobacteraceae bacterium]
MDLNRVSKEDFNAAKEAAYTGGDFGKENIRNMFRDVLDIPNLERYRAKIHDMKEFKTFDRDIWINKNEIAHMDKTQLPARISEKVQGIIKDDPHLTKCEGLKINIQKMEKTKNRVFQKSL